jgi:hypothetical protein
MQQEEISIVSDVCINQDESNIGEAQRAYENNYADGICPHCRTKIVEQKQVGRCVYALPCWHRLYQGRAPDKPAKIHPYLLGKDTWDEEN